MDRIPNGQFKRTIADCVRLIDTIRNNRFKAVGDMHKRGSIGPHAPNAKVQVIFLADEDKPITLSSAAAYAAHLKEAYKGLEQPGRPVLDTTIICLNHDNQSNPPRLLINRLSWKKNTNQQSKSNDWEHIDALFLCEQYGHNAVRIPQHVQPYLAELLLYTLLITPPMMLRPKPPETSSLLLPPPNTQETQQLPANTYLVGLNAIVYSGQWGRRYLNYSLVRDVISILNGQQYDQQPETRIVVSFWLRNWLIDVRRAIPDTIENAVPALQAFKQSTDKADAFDQVLASNTFMRPHVGNKDVQAFNSYADAIAQTYILSPMEQEEQWRRHPSSLSGSTTNTSEQISLESALICAPAIIDQLQTWQPGDPEPPLIRAQQEAQRVLSHPNFFVTVRGSLPRAKQQLDELSQVIRDLQNGYKQNRVDLKKQRKELLEEKEKTIADLCRHQAQFPLLAGLLQRKFLLALLTWTLGLGLGVIFLIVVFALLHYLLLAIPGGINFASIGVFGFSLYTLTLWVMIIATLLPVIYSGRAALLGIRNQSAMRVESYFLLVLTAYPILGLTVSYSASLQQRSPTNATLLWLANLPFWSSILLLIAITILLIEIIYYVVWHNALMNKFAGAVQKVKEHQRRTSDLVRNYLADTVSLELLRRAELTDGNGGPGPFIAV